MITKLQNKSRQTRSLIHMKVNQYDREIPENTKMLNSKLTKGIRKR